MNDAVKRYQTDPVFHMVVETFRMILRSATLTPSEVRDAAMTACVLEEMYRPAAPLLCSEEELARVRASWGAPPYISSSSELAGRPGTRDVASTPTPRQAPPGSHADRGAIDFGWDLEAEAFRLLDLINAEFSTDPKSVQCFDLRIVERVRRCLDHRRRAEHKGDVRPLLTATEPADGFHR